MPASDSLPIRVLPTPTRALREYTAVRAVTELLARRLSPEDQQAQSMPDASPVKWHRAHTSWFFETFVLAEHLPGYTPDPHFAVLFNSYYNGIGEQYPRARRGLVTRPGTAEITAYRERVDADVRAVLGEEPGPELLETLRLGLHHEQQHQELLLTDLKHLFARNPAHPALEVAGFEPPVPLASAAAPGPHRCLSFPGGEYSIGASPATAGEFAFDNEGPAHRVLLHPFALADRLVTNAEFLAFIEDGGYLRPELWLSAGWDFVREQELDSPLYWRLGAEGWRHYTLHGEVAVDPCAPVAHISYYEAEAYARWAGARLPTEHEWEVACLQTPPAPGALGARADSDLGAPTGLHPCAPAGAPGAGVLGQLFGSVWQWTRSSYDPYPRFRTAAGAVGEYNGKFMSGQYVLRGSSCATPRGHARATYRNFFSPGTRWQFSGVRLAEDRS